MRIEPIFDSNPDSISRNLINNARSLKTWPTFLGIAFVVYIFKPPVIV
jgi:hypothetical protein